jgi:tetratricopeptide (TPR) repeat protein
MSAPAIELPAAILKKRRAMLDFAGPLSPEFIVVTGACDDCQRVVTFASHHQALGAVRSMKELVDHAASLAVKTASKTPAAACPTCGARVAPSTVATLVFHSGLAHDIVILWSRKQGVFGSRSVALLKLDESGAVLPLGALSADDEACLVADLPFRAALALLDSGDGTRAYSMIRDLAALRPDDPLLLRLVPILMVKGDSTMGRCLADAYVKRRPEDADGHYRAAEALLTCVLIGEEPAERVADVKAGLERAVALRPGHRDAALALCNLLRRERRTEEGRIAFAKLVQDHPDWDMAHAGLASMVIEADPETALVHFTQAERLNPEDANYPVGCARALLALGRKAEAREAVKRARKLTSVHRYFATIERALSDESGRAEYAEGTERLRLELSLNDTSIASFSPRGEFIVQHIYSNLPVGSGTLRMLIDPRAAPLKESAFTLAVGDVVRVRVCSGGRPDLLASAEPRGQWHGGGTYESPGTRFEVAINDAIVATVGNPEAGGLSVDIIVDAKEKVCVALHATGSDAFAFRHWSFPFLQAGEVATIRVLGPGTASEPASVEPRKAAAGNSG